MHNYNNSDNGNEDNSITDGKHVLDHHWPQYSKSTFGV